MSKKQEIISVKSAAQKVESRKVTKVTIEIPKIKKQADVAPRVHNELNLRYNARLVRSRAADTQRQVTEFYASRLTDKAKTQKQLNFDALLKVIDFDALRAYWQTWRQDNRRTKDLRMWYESRLDVSWELRRELDEYPDHRKATLLMDLLLALDEIRDLLKIKD